MTQPAPTPAEIAAAGLAPMVDEVGQQIAASGIRRPSPASIPNMYAALLTALRKAARTGPAEQTTRVASSVATART